MTEDLKKFLAAIAAAAVLLIIATWLWGDLKREHQAKKQAEAQTFSSLSPEEKLRQKISHLVEYRHGQTVDGFEALQLTIQHDFGGFFTTLPEELNSTAARHIRAAYESHPTLETLDIDYHIKVSDPYGAESYVPALRIQIDRPNYERIEWNNFLSKNIPKVTTLYQPLRREAMP